MFAHRNCIYVVQKSSKHDIFLKINYNYYITGPGGPPGIFQVSRRGSPPLWVFKKYATLATRMGSGRHIGDEDGMNVMGSQTFLTLMTINKDK